VGAFGFAGSSGYQEDSDSSLKLLGHRYYDPSTGRFLTRDPAKDGRNWYGYCRNNPLHSTDRTGLVGGDGEDEAIVAELAEEAADEAADEAAAGGGGGGGGESTIGDGGGQGSGEAGGEGSGEGSNSCFTAGTLIAMADGSAKAIESVKAGDRVLTRDQKAAENAKTTSAGVARTYVKHPRETLVLKFADGATVHTTPGHRFYVHAKGFVHAKDLKVGFMIAESGKGLDRVASVARFLKPATVYNFEVSGKHTYFIRAGNAWLWVHNNCKPYSAGKAQQTVERGQAPDTIDRVDNPHGPAQPEPHVHNTGGGGSTISQQPTHGGWGYRPTNAEVKWFIRIGWPIPKWPL
jgi:RHS repeat-associated protein